MIAYLDTSIVLRIVLEEPLPLPEWPDLYGGVCSAPVAVECARTFDRYWQQNRFTEDEFATKQAETTKILSRLEVIPLTESALQLAARPLPTILGTLDAIHLATAVPYRASQPSDERPIFFATHDEPLARAARALNFDVLGVPA